MEINHPTIGRFFNIDPLASQASQVDKSPYAFTWNNPINLVDPDGLSPDTEMEDDRVTLYGKDGRALVSSFDNSNEVQKKSSNKKISLADKIYRLITKGKTQAYIDFIPDQDAVGNELSVGTQKIVETISVMTKDLVISDGGKSKFLFKITTASIITSISSDGSSVTSNLNVTEEVGEKLNNMKLVKSPTITKLSRSELSDFHNKMIKTIQSELQSSKKSLASAWRDNNLDVTGYGAGYSVYDIFKSVITRSRIDPVSAGVGLTHLSIKFSPMNKRLHLYSGNYTLRGSLTKPIKE